MRLLGRKVQKWNKMQKSLSITDIVSCFILTNIFAKKGLKWKKIGVYFQIKLIAFVWRVTNYNYYIQINNLLPILAGSIVAMVSIKAPRFVWITGLDIKLMMALMSSGALKVSAKLYVK